MNHDYFYYGNNPKTPQFEPHAGIKMAHGLVSPSSISVVRSQNILAFTARLIKVSLLTWNAQEHIQLLRSISKEYKCEKMSLPTNSQVHSLRQYRDRYSAHVSQNFWYAQLTFTVRGAQA